MGVLEYSLGSFQLAVFVIHLSVKQHLLVSGKKKIGLMLTTTVHSSIFKTKLSALFVCCLCHTHTQESWLLLIVLP